MNEETSGDSGIDQTKQAGDSVIDQTKQSSKDVKTTDQEGVDLQKLLDDPANKQIFDLARQNLKAEFDRKLDKENKKLQDTFELQLAKAVEGKLDELKTESKTEIDLKTDHIRTLEGTISDLETKLNAQIKINHAAIIRQAILEHYTTGLVEDNQSIREDLVNVLSPLFEVDDDDKPRLILDKAIEKHADEFRKQRSYFYNSDIKNGNPVNPQQKQFTPKPSLEEAAKSIIKGF
jgi:hypothetical protein